MIDMEVLQTPPTFLVCLYTKEAPKIAKFREKVKRVVDALCLSFDCTFVDANGAACEGTAGDWIVTESDGTQDIMDATEFEATFEAMVQKGPKPKTETCLDSEA